MIISIKYFQFVLVVLMSFSCVENYNKKAKTTITSYEKEFLEKDVKKVAVKDSLIGLKPMQLKSDVTKSYNVVKASIKKEKLNLHNKEISKDSLAVVFKRSLLNRIIPFWAGTTWSFEGHTSIPKKGEIACGYFVSTTLLHIGVNLNRYKLAQQSPINEAKSLALNSEVIEVAEESIANNISKIKASIKEGIHFIGFDRSHVGYILKEDNELYLIHSNYMGATGVEIERIEDSLVFSSFFKFYIVELSTSESFLRNWITGNELKIIH